MFYSFNNLSLIFQLEFLLRIETERREADAKRRRQIEEEEKRRAKELEEQRRKEAAKRQREDREYRHRLYIVITDYLHIFIVLLGGILQ